MKKLLGFIIVLFGTLFLTGCQSIIVNEIYHESYIIDIEYEGDIDKLANLAVKKAKQSVIGVSNYKRSALGLSLQGTGSGFVYKTFAVMNDGTEKDYLEVLGSSEIKTYKYYAITNRHVIEGKGYTPSLKVYLGNDMAEVEANLVQYDDKVDLAVITFKTKKLIIPVEFGDSDAIEEADTAFAIGSPSGFAFFNSVTSGVISNPKRYIESDLDNDGTNDWYDEYIQHDVAINPGNSGGPLINLKGQVIGINTMKFVDTDIDNMGFSIPSNLVLKIVPFLEQGKRPERATIGFSIYNLLQIPQEERANYNIDSDLEKGFYITSVNPRSRAEKAGILPGDVIIKFNGREINTLGELKVEINKYFVGSNQEIILTILRGTEEITVRITI